MYPGNIKFLAYIIQKFQRWYHTVVSSKQQLRVHSDYYVVLAEDLFASLII